MSISADNRTVIITGASSGIGFAHRQKNGFTYP